MSILSIDGAMLKRMIIAGANHLEKNKQIVDELNVFPVPDGDTGTNMSLTVLAAAREVEKTDSDDVFEVAKAAASGSLRGARGNSGVILSQLFRGFSKGLQNHSNIDTVALAEAFEVGVKTAYKAVMKPKEGTILTVAREATEKALQLSLEIDNIEEFLKEVLAHAHTVLKKTPDMLPVLKQAGVVDAGGRGLLYIIEGALKAINSNEEIHLEENVYAGANKGSFSALSSISNEDITFGYCTEFIINRADNNPSKVNELREFLNTIGDSIVVVDDDEVIKVHVHTDHPGQAIEKGLTLGSLTNMKIDNMREQHSNKVIVEEIKESKPQEKKPIGFIAVSIGEGIQEIFKGLGVDYIIQGGQTMNPSTEDILTAVDKVNAEKVIILPNNKNIILAAEQAQKLSKDKEVFVVPSKTIPQGIAAMIGFEPDHSIDETLESMNESMSYVKTGQITFAVRDTAIGDREIKKGNILGMSEGNIEVVSDQLEEAVFELIDKIVDEDSEIVSIYYGEDVKEEEALKAKEYIEENYPECEVEVHFGGQPLYYYIFSVE
ncbi:DAK2 domain-containing protein [Defluviitalea saccharophila]|uniref:DAK2 domain-containing protein n=1 Tax=Defluviitalea saccharophila TaxID=879970 RepID=A0ABZ2Y508_9FIRM